jgi:hypothetical protein
MSVESEMKTLVREKFGNHESEMKQLGRMLREKVDSWRNWRSERGWGSQAPSATQSTTKTCWQCRTEINSQARVCPHCRGKQAGKDSALGKVILCTLGFLLVVGAASKNSSTSSTQTATTQYRSQYETDLPSDNQRYPSGVVPTYHDKGVAAVLIYDTECSSVTPSIPPVMVRYAYLHAQDRIAEVNAVRQEFEQVVTTGGMKRSTGVKFWCSQMWQEMGASWSKFK